MQASRQEESSACNVSQTTEMLQRFEDDGYAIRLIYTGLVLASLEGYALSQHLLFSEVGKGQSACWLSIFLSKIQP